MIVPEELNENDDFLAFLDHPSGNSNLDGSTGSGDGRGLLLPPIGPDNRGEDVNSGERRPLTPVSQSQTKEVPQGQQHQQSQPQGGAGQEIINGIQQEKPAIAPIITNGGGEEKPVTVPADSSGPKVTNTIYPGATLKFANGVGLPSSCNPQVPKKISLDLINFDKHRGEGVRGPILSIAVHAENSDGTREQSKKLGQRSTLEVRAKRREGAWLPACSTEFSVSRAAGGVR